MKKLDGKIAVITGGNSGIGLAVARKFVDEGAHVFITGRRQKELDDAVTSIGKGVTAVRTDVTKLADLDALFQKVKAEKGRVDVLFVNAGVAEGAPLVEVSEDHFDRQFDTNVKGTLFTVQRATPLLSEGASVILTGSVVGSKGFAGRSVYSATKAAIRSFARTLTSDLKARGIRVNVVSPGPVDTEALRTLMGTTSDKLDSFYKDRIPLGRVGKPDDIVGAVTFLASDDSRFIAGAELFVDGGLAQV